MGNICAYDAPTKGMVDTKDTGRVEVEEEIIARKYEKACPIRFNGVDRVMKCFEAESGEKLSLSQTKRVFGAAGVVKEKMQNPDDAVVAFIYSFEDEDGFRKDEMLIAFIMLTEGRPAQKLKALFELFDTERKRIIRHKGVEAMLKSLFHIGCYNSLLLAAGEAEDTISRQGILNYYEKFKGYEGRFIEELKLIIFMGEEEIGQDRFIEVLSRGNYPKILSPSALREYIVENLMKTRGN